MADEQGSTRDLLRAASWECAASAPGDVPGPEELAQHDLLWIGADVPGTVASALRGAGLPPSRAPGALGSSGLDDVDWWYRAEFDASPDQGRLVLELGGLATVADVWLDGRHVLHSEDMFVAHRVLLDRHAGETGAHELVLRFAALSPLLSQRRPRPRWKSYLVAHQNLRWFRTSLLGRIPGWAEVPAPVGPWRGPARILSERHAPGPFVAGRNVEATLEGASGQVRVALRLWFPFGVPPRPDVSSARLRVGAESAPVDVRTEGDELVVEGSLHTTRVEAWWPHTHGAQPLYDLSVEVAGFSLDLGRVGFRRIEVDRSGDGFALCVNGERIFCRGAVWMPVDPVSLVPSDEDLGATLELAREAGMNMIRLPGTTVYEDERFWDHCDRLGILVWQDFMFAFMDPPDDPDMDATVERELASVLGALSGRPSLAVVCGGQEVESQPAMLGLGPASWDCPMQSKVIPTLVERFAPGTANVTSNPSGGTPPFRMDAGVAHYFGVGGYLRPLEDIRTCGLKFATECLAFAAAPSRRSVEEVWGGASAAGHDPEWKKAVHHDAGRSWDMEDMQGHYLRLLFGEGPFEARYRDADRAMDLGRATALTVVERAFARWRTDETCDGALILAMRDLRAGAGWGLVDTLGRPKAPWFGFRRTCSPLALLLCDEGLNGLVVHVVNDTDVAFRGEVSVKAVARGELVLEEGTAEVALSARDKVALDASQVLGGFRDLTNCYGFGPAAFDVVAVSLRDEEGEELRQAFHLPVGLDRPVEPDVGLVALARRVDERWVLDVSARRFAQWVEIDVRGFDPEDSWFHLSPGATRSILLAGGAEGTEPSGTVRAFNSMSSARIKVAEGGQ